MSIYPVVSIRSSRAEAVEYLGTKTKFWYRHGDTLMLFKAEERGTGEDWAEKICCELARMLGLPHVHYEMAHDIDQDSPGVVCASMAPPPLSLMHGNQLLFAVDPLYPKSTLQHYQSHAHTIEAVFCAVDLLDAPAKEWCLGTPLQICRAADVFAGYLMLDAWVANQDRHHENWGAVWDGQHRSLAPSFDHGAALARNLSDEERHERLHSRDANRRIPHFTRRARSALYARTDDARPLTTLEAWQAWASRVPAAARAWQQRLAAISQNRIAACLDAVPPDRMSTICRQFTLDLLVENQKRILGSEKT